MKSTYLVILIGCILYSTLTEKTYSQVNDQTSEKTITYHLQNKKFTELDSLFTISRKDTVLSKNIAKTYLFKAQKQKNVIEIANGYRMFYKINYKKELPIALAYTDSMIEVTKHLQGYIYPARAYFSKGFILDLMGQNNKALKQYLIALKLAEKYDNTKQIIGLRHNIAILKNELGKNEEALQVFKENYSILKGKDTIYEYSRRYKITILKIIDTYNRLSYYDSAHFYLEKAFRSKLLINDVDCYPNLLFSYGINRYYQEDYQSAKDSILKILALDREDRRDINEVSAYLILAKSLLKIGKSSEAISNLKKIDSMTTQKNYIPEIRETFVLLIDHFKKTNKIDKQLELRTKLMLYDSIAEMKYKSLNDAIVNDYDKAELVKKKDEIVETIIKKNNKNKFILFLTGFLLIFGLSMFYYFYSKNKKNIYKQELAEELKKVKNAFVKNTKSTASLELDEKLKEEILQKLKTFESSRDYLKNKLTLATVSKSLKTNSTYLSKVINLEKNKNFSNYINDLRIDYCIEQINTSKKFRLFSIKSMAKEVGFNNIQSFAKAFAKKTGVNPAFYVKNIDNK